MLSKFRGVGSTIRRAYLWESYRSDQGDVSVIPFACLLIVGCKQMYHFKEPFDSNKKVHKY